MTRSTNVVALSGSLADESVTRIAVDDALSAAETAGARTTHLDLRTYDLPAFDADHQDAGDAPGLRRQLRQADAVLLGTPMYHGSYSSPLKTGLDYSGFDEFAETTVGLLAVAGGGFPRAALDHLRAVVLALDAWPLPLDVAVPDASTAVSGGTLDDGPVRDRVQRLGADLVAYADVAEFPAAMDGEPMQPAD